MGKNANAMYETIVNAHTKKGAKKSLKIIAISIASIFVILCILFTINYIAAPKKAESVVATHLAKDDSVDFLSFNKIYDEVSVRPSGLVVELSGSIISSRYQDTALPFYAKIKLNYFRKNEITKLKINGENLIQSKPKEENDTDDVRSHLTFKPEDITTASNTDDVRSRLTFESEDVSTNPDAESKYSLDNIIETPPESENKYSLDNIIGEWNR